MLKIILTQVNVYEEYHLIIKFLSPNSTQRNLKRMFPQNGIPQSIYNLFMYFTGCSYIVIHRISLFHI